MRTLALPVVALILGLAFPAAAGAQDVDLLHAVPTTITVSSAYRGRARQATFLADGDRETAWNSARGDLVGAWIEVALPADARVSSIRMTTGFTREQGGRDLFMGNHRVTDVAVLHGDDVTLAQLEEEPTLQTVAVSGGGGTYRILITGLFPGDRRDWRETCISELQVLGSAPGARPGQVTPTTRVAPSASPGPGGVFFAVNNTGVGVVREGGRAREVYRDSYVFLGLVATGDGVFALDEEGLYATDGGRRRPLPPLPRRDEARALARDAQGRLLVLGGRGVYRRAGRRWQSLGVDLTPMSERGGFWRMAVDGRGAVWLLHSTRGPHRIRDGALEAMTIPGARGPFQHLVAGPEGTVAVGGRAATHRFDGTAWRTANGLTPGSGGGLAVGPGGDVWVGQYRNVTRFGAAGEPSALQLPGGLTIGSMHTAAYDPQGNLWVAGSGGVHVLAPDLRVLRTYRNLPVLEGGVEFISVLGDGPFH